MSLEQRLHDYSPLSAAFARLMLEVFRLNGLLLASGDRLSADMGQTSARWQVLAAVRIADEPVTVAQIARNMGLTRQSVQRIVDLLHGEGLVELSDNPRHKRARLVALSGEGLAVTQRLHDIHRQWAEQLVEGLDERPLMDAYEVLQQLRERLESE